MKNTGLRDYLTWRGDLPISADGFHDVDNVILCELAYVDLMPVLGIDGKIEMTLRQCGEIIESGDMYNLKTLTGGQEDFFKQACASRRFGDLTVRQYSEILDSEKNLQFAAVEFVLDNRTSYIAYRGTDNTLVGWKEDFMMSFTRISGQSAAAGYLRRVIRPFRKYYVGGHSKGGNLALYACAHLPVKLHSRILKIYNNDGPGFSPDRFDLTMFEPFKDRIVHLLPGFSIVGRIFELELGERRVVASAESGLVQHDLINWQVSGPEMIYLSQNEDVSVWMSEAIDTWLEKITDEERRHFVDELFEILSAGGAFTVQEITGKGFIKVLSAAAGGSELSRRLVKELAETMLRTGSEQIGANNERKENND